MPTSIVLLICVFILYCTGSGRGFSEKLSVEAGLIAAACLLLAAVAGYAIAVTGSISLNPASMLLLTVGFLLCRKQQETHVSVLLAFLCGILGWFLLRLFPQFFEPGILLALPAALLSQLLPTGMRQKLLCVVLSPLFFGLVATLEDWYLFDKLYFSFGNALQCNAQVFGLVALFAVAGLPTAKSKKVLDMQKEY